MSHSDAHIERARLLMSWERDAEAEEELRGALLDDPDHATAHALLGLVLLRLNRAADAWAECKAALSLAPEDPSGHWVMSWLYLHEGHPDAAENAAFQAIELEPDSSPLYAQLARCRAADGRWKQALVAADQGLTYDPHDNECLKLRLESLRNLGCSRHLDDATRDALKNDPEDSETFAYAGWCELQTGDLESAKAQFMEAVRLDPTNQHAHHGLQQVERSANPLYRILLRWSLGKRLRRYLISIAIVLVLLAVREWAPSTDLWTSICAGMVAAWAHIVLIFALAYDVP